VSNRRRPTESGPLIERIVLRCILSFTVVSVAAVLLLSLAGRSP
jgi:hypothetical protein